MTTISSRPTIRPDRIPIRCCRHRKRADQYQNEYGESGLSFSIVEHKNAAAGDRNDLASFEN
jgi:hypothetical protein